MKKFSSSLCAALAFSIVLGTAAPVMAAPLVPLKVPTASAEVIQVQNRRERRFERRLNRVERRQERRVNRIERRQDRRAVQQYRRGNNSAYYRGHRGYRERRPGYRQHNGFWFPPAAFIAGAIIGGALSQPSVGSGGGSAHVQWCYDRWRSYRASDNTYQPYNGGRQYCTSPYS